MRPGEAELNTLMGDYWQWCDETPCIDTVHTFAVERGLDPVLAEAIRRLIRRDEWDMCHPTRNSFTDCRDGIRADCHWHLNHSNVMPSGGDE